MNIVYQNKYGRVEFQIVEAYRPVSTIHSKDLDQSLFFTIDEAEKIALITGNDGIQLCFAASDFKKAFLIHHTSSDVAAVCQIVSLQFDQNVNATKELERPNPYFYGVG